MPQLRNPFRSLKRAIRDIPGVQPILNRCLLRLVEPGSLGLTTPAERDYYFHVASTRFQGRGGVVDLGSWLGSTTVSLARGIAANQSATARSTMIDTYDLFTWSSEYDEFAPRGFRFEGGESFLPLFRANARPWLKQIRIHEGDLTRETWTGPVELILNDAAKSWALAANIWRQFVAQLIEGGFLIEQDFKHYYCPWLHLLHYRFRQCFTLDHDVAGGSTTAFRLTQSITSDQLVSAFEPTGYSADECKEAFEWSSRLVDPAWQPVLHAAHAMHYVHLGEAEAARRIFEQIAEAGRLHPDVRHAEARLLALENQDDAR